MTARLDDWDALSAEWRRQTPATSSAAVVAQERLRARVRRHNRGQWIVLASEIALTLGMAALVRSLLAQPGGRGVVVAIVFVVVTLFVWSFALWNRRGSWRPLGETTADYLRLSYTRARAGRRSVHFVRAALLVSFAAYGPWFALRLRDGLIEGAEWWRWGFYAAYCAGYLAWCSWYSRRLDRQLAMLREIEREVGEEMGDGRRETGDGSSAARVRS
jgi:hypothetical protein